MEGIAKSAGVNKERLYNYFGDKTQVFAAVLTRELAKVADAVPIEVVRTYGAGEYAGQCFDYLAANPDLMRLLHWEALVYGDGPVPDEERRSEHYRQKVASFKPAVDTGNSTDQPDAACLYSTILAMAHWWFALPQIARMITGSDANDPAEYHRRRAAIVDTVNRLSSHTLTAPGRPEPSRPSGGRRAGRSR
jgi:AcrR family transcriptional regulator